MARFRKQAGRFVLCLVGIVTVILMSCQAEAPKTDSGNPVQLDEAFRPHYHFSPVSAWMNDPNGLVYHEGTYHLFYQHNPHDTVWGPMHWGHAVSADLVNWTHLPIALYPDEVGFIFSGSAVVDWHNTAGFGKEAIVTVFTHESSGRQMQSLAYSNDNGRSWTKFADNPIIDPPNNIRNFRDPKVFWFERENGAGHWIMLVSAGNIILFYTSPDLRTWTPTGGFGLTHGAHGGFWETPDLFRLPVDGGPETGWLLAVAVQNDAPAGGNGVQYFVGDFDGEVFTNGNPPKTVLWADYGADFYAAQGWNEAPDGRSIWAAWMNNWQYANEIPTSTWAGSLTLPRELSLRTTPDGIRLAQRPLPELAALRGEHWSWTDESITAVSPQLNNISDDTLEIIAEFPVSPNMDVTRFGLRLRSGPGEQTTIGYVTREQKVFVDRSQSGKVGFSEVFPAVHSAPLPPVEGVIKLHLFVDRSSVELFANDGLVTLTDRIFPEGDRFTLELFADGGNLTLQQLDVYRLNGAEFAVDESVDAD